MKHTLPPEQEIDTVMPDKRVSSESIAAAVGLLRGHPVLVIGDVMLDEYQTGTVERISPEAPVPVVRIESERYTLGGAANVAWNIRTLGGTPLLIGICGEDRAGRHLQQLLDAQGIAHHLIHSRGRNTTVKTRILAQGQQIVRIDRETTDSVDAQAATALLDHIRRTGSDHGVALVSDYGKKVVTEQLLQALRETGGAQQRILVDPKVRNFDLYRNVYCLTPNAQEAGQAAGLRITSREDVVTAGSRILKQTKANNLLITLGGQGMALFQADGSIWHIPTAARNVYDVTGAGDTVIATLALALSAGLGTLTGSIVANFAAGLVVGQVGTAVVTPQELTTSIASERFPAIESWSDAIEPELRAD